MNRGDIVLIKFPYTDLTANKLRPALVVSSNTFHSNCDDAIFLAISSVVSNIFKTDVLVSSTDEHFAQTGLRQSSLIKAGKLVTLKKAIARRRLGTLSQKAMENIDQILLNVLSLSDSIFSQQILPKDLVSSEDNSSTNSSQQL